MDPVNYGETERDKQSQRFILAGRYCKDQTPSIPDSFSLSHHTRYSSQRYRSFNQHSQPTSPCSHDIRYVKGLKLDPIVTWGCLSPLLSLPAFLPFDPLFRRFESSRLESSSSPAFQGPDYHSATYWKTPLDPPTNTLIRTFHLKFPRVTQVVPGSSLLPLRLCPERLLIPLASLE